jgi:hypothetical protein|tara:strand:+ start:1289 stop:1900 length:612 start_codon:yes stop_codon:yes gene_type:complete
VKNVTDVKNELRLTLLELGVEPDLRWSEASLKEKIAVQQAALIETSRIYTAREAEKAKEFAAQRERISLRGEFATFSAQTGQTASKADRHLSCVTRWAQHVIDNHAKLSAKFAEEYAENPLYAMSWSSKYFEHAAAYTVAIRIKSMFDSGVSVTALLTEVMREVFHRAKYPANSTSPTSNICDTTILATWAKVADMLQGEARW